MMNRWRFRSEGRRVDCGWRMEDGMAGGPDAKES